GRVKTYESIVKGNDISEPGIPESFKVLLKELQSLSLDMKVLTENHEEINLKDLTDEGDDLPFEPRDRGETEVVDLGLDKAAEEPTEEEEDVDIFVHDDDTFDSGDEFKSGELFDDFYELDDLDDLDGGDDGDEE
ncbi:MAG TPA: DNA-directed RNA polymerase subunit beta, partial [Clostridiales bacterium]|nr:DNA-directed RNA polymerase subunit beta [Clostridiales bacterium]